LEALAKLSLGALFLAALSIGGLKNFGPTLVTLTSWILSIAFGGFAIYVLARILLSRKTEISDASKPASSSAQETSRTATTGANPPLAGSLAGPRFLAVNAEPPSPRWTLAEIAQALTFLDWYQFEKFCAEILEREGYRVERKGGAKADGGVDLVAFKDGQSVLIQCKQWRTWKVKENIVRELLGSMTHYQVARGALYTLCGATGPAAIFASKSAIEIINATDLARRALARFSESELTARLDEPEHLCPKCDAPMIWRTGNFDPFFGCSTYPRCRGIVKVSDVNARAVQS